MAWRSYEYRCNVCPSIVIEIFQKGEQPEQLDCEACGEESSMRSIFPTPAVLRASYPDGTKRGDKWQLTKEASKLQHEAARAKKRGDRKEASKLNSEASKLSKKASGKKDTVDK